MSRNQRTIQQQQQQRPLLVDGGGGGGGDEVPIITCTSTAEVTSTVVTIAHGRPGEGGRVAMDTGTNGRQGLGKRQSTGSLRSAWRLKYQDFVPGKSSAGHWEKSEPFRSELNAFTSINLPPISDNYNTGHDKFSFLSICSPSDLAFVSVRSVALSLGGGNSICVFDAIHRMRFKSKILD